MIQPKIYHSLAEAAELAGCRPADLLHYAVQGRIVLLVRVPQGIELRTYDTSTSITRPPFLMAPEFLSLMKGHCSILESYGETEQSDFSEGYFLGSSGQLTKVLPSYGRPELHHKFAYWRTFERGVTHSLRLSPERLLVMHSDLEALIQSGNARGQEAKSAPRNPKDSRPAPARSMRSENPVDPIRATPEKPPLEAAQLPTASPPDQSTALAPSGAPSEAAKPASPSTAPRILRIAEVVKSTGVSRSTIYDKMNPKSPRHDPTFPKRRKLGTDSVGWLELEVQAWIDSRVTVRSGDTPKS